MKRIKFLGRYTDHPIQDRKRDLVLVKRTCHIIDISVPADHVVKVKEGKKLDEYPDLVREPNKKINK